MADDIDRTRLADNDALPSMKKLAVTAFVACLPLIGLALFAGYRAVAVGLVGGAAICVILYWMLRAFVTRGMDVIAVGLHGSDRKSAEGSAKLQFGMLAIGKFILLAILLYVMLGVLRVNVIGFGAGFIVAQVSVTLVTVAGLKKT